VGACEGARFETGLVGAVEGMEGSALRDGVEELVQEGLVVLAGDALEFVHDRVQEAAYEALPDDERMRVHQRLAPEVDRRSAGAQGNAELFAILHHCLRSLPLFEGAAERRMVAELCLRGGQKAKAGSAYVEAVRFLRTGKDLLGEQAKGPLPELSFAT